MEIALARSLCAIFPVRLSYLILLIVMNCFWAGSLSMYKALTEHLTPGVVVTLRFGIGACLLLPFWPWMAGNAPRGFDLLKTAFMGVIVFMLGHRMQVWGDELGGAGNSSVLMGMEPIVTSVGAAIFLREKIGPRRWLGFTLGLLGMALVNRLGNGGLQWAGITASLIFISSFLAEALYSIMGKGLMDRAGMLKILTLALVFGTIANLLFDGHATFTAVKTLPANSWWELLYLATFCTAIGYAVWFLVIKETDVNLTALTIFVQPIAGVAIAALWLHEPLHWGQFWGSLAIVAGLVLGLSRQKSPE